MSSAPRPSPSDPAAPQTQPARVHAGLLMVLLLAGLSAIGPFSIDTYLPAFPAMEAELAADPLAVQQTLAAYMATFAFMTLWHGALSDSFGRRRIMGVPAGRPRSFSSSRAASSRARAARWSGEK